MNKILIAFVIVLVAAIGGFIFWNSGAQPKYELATAIRTNISEEVNVTGRVEASESVDLAFERTGRISRVYVNVGSIVKPRDPLVALESGEVAAQIAQAGAAVQSAKAQLSQFEAALLKDQSNLTELRIGTRPEQILVQEIKILNAKFALADAERNLANNLQDAYTKADDSVRNKADQMFQDPQTFNPQLLPRFPDSTLEADVESRRAILNDTLRIWRLSLDKLNEESNLHVYLIEAKKNLGEVRVFLDNLALGLNNPNTYYIQNGFALPVPSSWKTDVSTARVNVNTAITNLSASEEKLQVSESSVALEEQELALMKAGTLAEQIASQEAQVKQSEANVLSQMAKIKEAEANLTYYRVQLEKTILRSPVNALVVSSEAKVGEIVIPNVTVISLKSESNFDILTNMPEADIAKVNIDDAASVTLDAYGRDVIFPAKIVSIDPAETIIDGVATFKVTLRFIELDERIRSGMTAKISIVIASREGVIVIPQRAVIKINGADFVRVLINGTVEEVPVEIGLRGSDGNVEIISGISEGDQVITFIEE